MTPFTPDGRKLLPEDFWVRKTHSPTEVLAESHNLLLMYMQFVTFFSQELLKPELSLEEKQGSTKGLANYVESVNNVMKAVEYYMNVKLNPPEMN